MERNHRGGQRPSLCTGRRERERERGIPPEERNKRADFTVLFFNYRSRSYGYLWEHGTLGCNSLFSIRGTLGSVYLLGFASSIASFLVPSKEDYHDHRSATGLCAWRNAADAHR